jgi:hypothetical protein
LKYTNFVARKEIHIPRKRVLAHWVQHNNTAASRTVILIGSIQFIGFRGISYSYWIPYFYIPSPFFACLDTDTQIEHKSPQLLCCTQCNGLLKHFANISWALLPIIGYHHNCNFLLRITSLNSTLIRHTSNCVLMYVSRAFVVWILQSWVNDIRIVNAFNFFFFKM